MLEPYELSEWTDVCETELDGEPEADGSTEFEAHEDIDISEVGEFEKLELGVSIELWDGFSDGVVVNDPCPEGVSDTVGLTDILEDADNEAWDVDVFDTDVDPDTVLDLTGVADVLGETVWDLDTIGVMEALGVSVPVFDTDVDPEAEFVDDMLPVELGDELLVEEAQLEAEGDAVEDCVEQEDIVSDLLCEDDPVYEFVSMAEIDGLEDIDGAELTVG